ncbi:AraC family transcriptional regulator [Actinosynnema sp. NPDC050436]|uniref:helix-turn-helix domain-containing protein n=1 Tax=Actinosynnema sp. NPDC050436 TaxID=3155659 RepID=UPI0033D819BA
MADWSIVVPHDQVVRVEPLVFGAPAAPGVLSYSAHDNAGEAQHWTVAPLGAVTVMLDLVVPHRPGLPWSPVNGLRDRPFTASQEGRAVGVTVGLSPAAAYALFGPLRELANASVGLADLAPDAHLLAERLAGLPTPQARFAELDRYLTGRVVAGHRPDPQVRHAWQRLHRSGGAVRIADLADEVGWTRQHLHTRFSAQFGLGPKGAARVLRLHRAVGLLHTAPAAAVAAACGYADQSHFNRDYRALTGLRPSDRFRPPGRVTPTGAADRR